MTQPNLKTVAVVGTGVIGRGWIHVFSAAGCRTRIYDPDLVQTDAATTWLQQVLDQDIEDGFITENDKENRQRLISTHQNLEDALDGVEYVQESGPERLEVKQSLFAEMDRTAHSDTILASSTSTIDIEDIAAGLAGKSRCITAHPFNPPYVLPAVEMMPTQNGDPAVFERAVAFMKSVGQKPVRMNKFIRGYLANRIQAAVVREAIHIVNKGIADVEAVDAVISEALGLRWAVFGNFGTNHTNADGGIREYYTHYGQVYQGMMNDLDSTAPEFDPEMIEKIGEGVDRMFGSASVARICRWRDTVVRGFRAVKDRNPRP